MCGRFGVTISPSQVEAFFHVDDQEDWEPNHNIKPGTDIPVIFKDGGSRVLRLFHWGLVPRWSKDKSSGYKMINARAETAAQKPAFRDAFKSRRCIIPATVFYEWKKDPGGKTPYAVSLKSGEPMALAGLWEVWIGPESETLRSCVILTTEPNELLRPIHDRMPVVIPTTGWGAWLDTVTTLPETQNLLQPYPSQAMNLWVATGKL